MDRETRLEYEHQMIQTLYDQACDAINKMAAKEQQDGQHMEPVLASFVDSLAYNHVKTNTEEYCARNSNNPAAFIAGIDYATKSAILVAFEVGKLAERAGLTFTPCNCHEREYND